MNNIEFLKTIANGFNPITGEAFDEDDLLREPEVSNRLLDLVQTLQEDEHITKQCLQENYVYDSKIEKLIEHSEPSKFSTFATKISSAIKNNAGREIWHWSSVKSKIEKFLLFQGKIEKQVDPETRRSKYFATESGINFGISNEIEPEKSEFARHFLNFDTTVQEYLISNLPEILKIPSSTNNFGYSTKK